MSSDEYLKVADAARYIGVSAQSVANWIKDEKVTVYTDDGKEVLSIADCDTIKELQKEHGIKWHKFTDWNQSPAAATKKQKNKKTKKAGSEEKEVSEGGDRSNAQKIADLGNKLLAGGSFEDAAAAFAILVNGVDWSEVVL